MNEGIPIEELPADVRRKMGLKVRASRFSKEKVRTYALRAMNALAELSQQDRTRVIEHMKRLNRI